MAAAVEKKVLLYVTHVTSIACRLLPGPLPHLQGLVWGSPLEEMQSLDIEQIIALKFSCRGHIFYKYLQ